jgi:hypothetical protein
VNGKMNRAAYYKGLFIISALVWNFLFSVPFLLLSFFDGVFTGAALMYYQLFLLFVIVFGIGYIIVGLNLDKNHGIVLLCIIAKIFAFIFFVAYYLSGDIPFIQAMIGTGDLIFAILFIEFLINYKKLA